MADLEEQRRKVEELKRKILEQKKKDGVRAPAPPEPPAPPAIDKFAEEEIKLKEIAQRQAEEEEKKRKEIAKDLIVGYLQAKGYKMISFRRVRQEFSSNYSEEFLEKLIQEFPKEVRRTKLKGGKPGIGRVLVETTDEEEA